MKDDSFMDSLTIDELKSVLQGMKKSAGRKLDVLGMDACYMAMGEIAYEVRKEVEILVGAEGLEPTIGWPYAKILQRAKAQAASQKRPLSARELAAAIVDVYVEHYSDFDRSAGRSADMAAIQLGRIEEVKDRFEGLVTALGRTGKEGHDELLLAHWYAQTYKSDQFVDLLDLCVQIQRRSASDAVMAHCDRVIEALEGCVLKSGCSGFACQHSHGLSIYFPWALVSPDYDNLAFARDTGWRRFLQEHVRATRREARYPEPGKSNLKAARPREIPLNTIVKRGLGELKALVGLSGAGARRLGEEGVLHARRRLERRQ